MRSRGDAGTATLEPRAARLARLAVLVALAGAVQGLESLIPLPIPWLRLGLANAPVLVALELWGAGDALFVALGKVLLGNLLAGRLLSPAFALSLGGTVAATVAMALGRFAPLGFVGVSCLGAQAHSLAQLTLASVLLRTPAVWLFAPLMSALSVASAIPTGLLAHALARSFGRPPSGRLIPSTPEG